MSTLIFFGAAFVLSLAAIVFFAVAAYRMNKADLSQNAKIREPARTVVTPFHSIMLGVFISAFILLIPVYFESGTTNENIVLRIFESVFLAFYNSLRLFILEGDYETVALAIPAVASIGLDSWYSFFATALFIAAPVMTAGFVLSFFKDTYSLFRYHVWHPTSDVYLMSELNERSLALAEDIMTNPNIKGKRIVVFADVLETEEEERVELIAHARRLHAICFKKDITEIGLKYKNKKITRKIYFISENEDKNLRQALEMIQSAYAVYYPKGYTFSAASEEEGTEGNGDKEKTAPFAKNAKRTQFYVFASNRASEALIDSVPKGDMKVRRVFVSRNLAMSILQNHSVFLDAVPLLGSEGSDTVKEMNIVIVGLGTYGTELLKAISWCGQMKGYILNIHVFDRTADGEDRIRAAAPDLIRYNRVRYAGEPYYNIRFHSNINVDDYTFLEAISAIRNVTTAYVMLGDDEVNIETAIAMRTQFERDKMEKGSNVPPVFAVVYDTQKREVIMNNHKANSLGSKEYGVYLIGDLATRYSVSTIEQLQLEEKGFEVHRGYYGDTLSALTGKEKADKLAEIRYEYEHTEYCRRSSMAVAVHEHCRRVAGLFYDRVPTKEDKMLEHCRWSAYMRAEGYVGSPHGKNPIGKTHGDLIPYDRLSDGEKRKDLAVITAKRQLGEEGQDENAD